MEQTTFVEELKQDLPSQNQINSYFESNDVTSLLLTLNWGSRFVVEDNGQSISISFCIAHFAISFRFNPIDVTS